MLVMAPGSGKVNEEAPEVVVQFERRGRLRTNPLCMNAPYAKRLHQSGAEAKNLAGQAHFMRFFGQSLS
jgi:hypothetical protein